MLLACLLVLPAVLGLLPTAQARADTGAPSPAPSPGSLTTPGTGTDGEYGPESAVNTGSPLVVIGVPGLSWGDINPDDTPALWSLARGAGLSAMSVRAIRAATCPVDGWLTLGAGKRAAAGAPDPVPAPADGQAATADRVHCRAYSTLSQDGRTVEGPGAQAEPAGDEPAAGPGFESVHVDEFSDYRAFNGAQSYDTRLGAMTEQLARDGMCVSAVGRGAALAVAHGDGQVDHYLPSDTVPTEQQWRRCPVTVVDPGAMIGGPTWFSTDVEPQREQQARRVDAAVARYLRTVPAGFRVMVAGISDATATPHLSAVILRDEDVAGGYLNSRSTRRAGLIQLTDVAPTVLRLVGAGESPDAVGIAATRTSRARPALDVAAGQLGDLDVAAHSIRGLVSPFFAIFVVAQLVLYVGVGLALRAGWGVPRRRAKILALTRWSALVFAAVPAATLLANAVPWWNSRHAGWALAVGILVSIAAIVAVATLGPWRHHILGPVGAIGLITAGTLGADVVTGSNLQFDSLLGYNPLVGGRFYGMGGMPTALFLAGGLLGTASVVSPLMRRGRRAAAVWIAIGAGLLATVLVANPSWGAAFGAVIAVVPAYTVLALMLAGVRITWRRLVLVVAAGLATVLAVCFLDWLRPADQRSHFGLFFAQILDGEAPTVIWRKLLANLNIVTINPALSALVPLGLLFIVVVLMRPLHHQAAALYRAYRLAPTLRAGFIATLVGLLVAFSFKDSGAAIPAAGMTLVVPLVIAACAAALQRSIDENGEDILAADARAAGGAPAEPEAARP